MNIKVLASTKEGYKVSKKSAMIFSGKAAGICYLPNTARELFSESEEKTMKRVKGNLLNGHHSVFGHVTYNLLLEDVPKILAIILNNEKAYTTSEKSARYTKMRNLSLDERILYDKWNSVLKKRIIEVYPNFTEKQVEKLAQENARYMISIFTPATTMEYTVSFEQLNYILYWFRDYIKNEAETPFSTKLKPILGEFVESLSDYEVKELNPKVKGRKLSVFANRARREEWGENYCTSYMASFAQLAQAQRHRTLSYEFSFASDDMENKSSIRRLFQMLFGSDEKTISKKFYIPEIIRNTPLEKEWDRDLLSLQDDFPQGMLVLVNERGTIENFVQKCTERLCGAAQLEIMKQTEKTLWKYYSELEDKQNYELAEYLKPLLHSTKCQFLAKNGFVCHKPCPFKPGGKKREEDNAIFRMV